MSDGFNLPAQGPLENDPAFSFGYFPQAGNGGGFRNGLLNGGALTLGAPRALTAATTQTNTQTSSNVETKHPQYIHAYDKWVRARDVCAGQDAVHAAGIKYLPQLYQQPLEEYQAMVKRATFYNASFRTVAGFVGMLSSKPPAVEVPDTVKAFLQDVTLTGLSLEAFLKNLEYEMLTPSRAGIFVDYPQVAETDAPLTKADVSRLNLRPTLSIYTAESIFNWQFGQINNKTQLTQVRLYELDVEVVDEFTSNLVPIIKVLDLDNGKYRIRKFKKEGGEQIGVDVYPTLNNKLLDYIPFWIVTPDGINADVDDPVLIDLFDLNLAHYRVTADYEHVCHLSAIPTPVITGYDNQGKQPIYLGSTTILCIPEPTAQVKYLEVSGNGINAIKDNLGSKESQMAAIGARMLAPEKSGVEAADTLSMRHNGENSIMASVAISISEVMKPVLNTFSAWCGVANADCSCEINRDFAATKLDGPTLLAYIQAVQTGNMSKQTFFALLQRGDLIAPDVTFDEEQANIDSDPPPTPSLTITSKQPDNANTDT